MPVWTWFPGKNELRYTGWGIFSLSHPRSRWSLIPHTRALRKQSCLHVYLPCWKASGQLERLWWIVVCLLPQRGQLESTFSRHHLKLSGVGNVSVPALRSKDNRPAERSCVTLLHIWFAFSSSTTTTALDCTESCLSLLLWFSADHFLTPLLHYWR